MNSTCFVAMAISGQNFGETDITTEELRNIYDNVIKAALENAKPGLDIIRADECAVPGTITSDILDHIMNDEFMVVDITYPNPNVYYELGVRHCCKPGTILIRNREIKLNAPFDISHQRYIEYDCTAKGVRELSKSFRDFFSWYEKNPGRADNQVLTFAKYTKHKFPDFADIAERNQSEPMANLFMMIMGNPSFLKALTDNSMPEEEKNMAIMQSFTDKPEAMKLIMDLMFDGDAKNLLKK
ncbi:hypothetical protein [Hymenobacter nivis]|uniref:hypothetical protein n=1 Tax=Hymenobacter nivis TaxID=1850093 RepID=UPI0013A56A77|nr:hypothetical protein [Hymenobacter nivis]